ncbi:hypothetical protein [Scytonema sp. UIC 10036]|uniref:hypothetical protein n=1 Tax=Scytonema sp. UIC 10036 TaxID=2304196 RepID=UPI001A9BEC3E|nr:hypothetical protein [Scytonema sp. UIC 10036]
MTEEEVKVLPPAGKPTEKTSRSSHNKPPRKISQVEEDDDFEDELEDEESEFDDDFDDFSDEDDLPQHLTIPPHPIPLALFCKEMSNKGKH